MADNRIMITLPYTVDLDRCPVEQHLPMSFGTGDKEAHKIIMTAYRATGIVDLSGAGVICYVNRADKSTVVVDAHVEDGKAVIVLPEECYAINGSVSIVVKLTLDETRTTVLWLIGSVNRTSNGKLVDPGNVVPSLEELLAQIAEIEAATEKANTAAESAQAAASAAYTAAETSSPPVVLSGEGKAVTLDGAAEGRRMVGLRVFGASTQSAAPAPDAPVDVDSVTEPVVTLTGTDGAVQTMTVAGVTLRGVQVTGEADYTDADGAKWVADEVDFGRGVMVSRIGVRVFDGTESWTSYGVTTGTYRAWQGSYSKMTERVDRGAVMTHYPVLAIYADLYYGRVVGAYAGGAGMDMGRIILCGDYATAEDLQAYLAAQHAAGTPLTVYYVQKEPVETALTAEQLASFAALRCGADMTVSSGAWVRTEYVADTMHYTETALATKLTEPATGLSVGKYFRVKALDESGHAVLEAVDAAQVGVQDVQVSGQSIVADGVANVALNSSSFSYSSSKILNVRNPNESDIRLRKTNTPITCYANDIAVKAAMCDGKGAAWTSEEQAAARERMCVENGADFELLVDATLEEEVNTFKVVFPKPVRECIYHIWFYNNNESSVVAQTKCLDSNTDRYYLLKYTSGIATGRGYALNGYFRYNGPISSRSIIGYASDSNSPLWTTDLSGNGNTTYMAYPTAMSLGKADCLSFELVDTSHVLNVGATIKVWGR